MSDTLQLTSQILTFTLIRCDLSRPWPNLPGIYAFTTTGGMAHPASTPIHYIGECSNFGTRPMPPQHERWAEAVRDYRANAVFVMATTKWTEASRKQIEREFIQRYKPPMNTQHKTGTAGLTYADKIGSLARMF